MPTVRLMLKKLTRYALITGTLATLGCLAGCHHAAPTRPVTQQVVVLGFDGADPKLAAKWIAEGKLPNLARLAEQGTFKPLGTTNPPESPVAWAAFATGLNPGATGIFDFLKRDPQTYLPELALVSRQKGKFLWGMVPVKLPKVTNARTKAQNFAKSAVWSLGAMTSRLKIVFGGIRPRRCGCPLRWGRRGNVK